MEPKTEKYLKAIPYLRDLDAALLSALASKVVLRRYSPGEVVVPQGAPVAGACVVVKGLVQVAKESPDDRAQVLRLVGPGESFAEVPALEGGPSPAGARALDPSVVMVVPTAELKRLVESRPEVARAVVRALARRTRHLMSLVEDLAFRTVTARVAKALLTHSGPLDCAHHRRCRLTQRDLAALVGSRREVVGVALRTLESTGAIRADRGRLTILDPEGLRELAGL